MSDAPPEAVLMHASCVAFDGLGVLLVGPSGAGKSDLALRLLDEGGRGVGQERLTCSLVSDDQVALARQGDHVLASAPASIEGYLEVRGIGILGGIKTVTDARLGLVVTLVKSAEVERMPHFGTQVVNILGVDIPEILVCAKEMSAAAKVRCAVQIIQKSARLVDFAKENSGPEAKP